MKSFNDYIIHKARDEPEKVVKARFNVQKSYEEQHLVFGWANVSARADGEKITDWQEDIIDIDELEKRFITMLSFTVMGANFTNVEV